jgi:hypothetical protein
MSSWVWKEPTPMDMDMVRPLYTMDDNMDMVETIRNLKKYFHSHKADNERLMKAREQQEDLNMKLMKRVDRIEKILDKESGSKKSGS